MGFNGFDNVELIMGLEDRLGISIPDADAEKLKNPGDLVEYLVHRLHATHHAAMVRCRSADAFRAARRRLADSLGMSRPSMRPATPMAELLRDGSDIGRRRAEWARLSCTLGAPLPELQHPARYQRTVTGVGLVVFSLCVVHAAQHKAATLFGGLAFATTTVLFTLGIPYLLLLATRHWLAGTVPAGFDTLGDVVSCLTLASIPEDPQSASDGWTSHELWELVRDMTALSAGCPPSRIHRETAWASL